MRRPALWQLFLLAACLWGGEYLRRDLWEPDEARFAYVSREMAQDGHWLVPHRSGEYYAHKPPLLFWLTNLAAQATSLPIGRIPCRLPGFFAGILALWATARLAGRWAGTKAAWPAVLTLCTTYLFWHEIGFARMDGLLLGWTTAALALLFLNDDEPSAWRPALAWLCMGLGILTKGPVGLLIPVGAYAAARLAAGEGRLLRKAHWIWGPLVAPAGYFHELLFAQNVERAAGDFGHVRPFYYFFTTLPLDLLPWTLCLPAALLVLKNNPEHRRLLRRLGGWIGFIFIFFSCISSKRNIYVLGLFPAVAILIGTAWSGMNSASFRWARFARGALVAFLLFIGAALLAAGFLPSFPLPAWAVWPAGLLGVAGGLVLWRESRHPRPSPCFYPLAALALLAMQWAAGLFIYPAANALKTPVELARIVQERLPPDRPLLLYRMNGEILAYYSNRRGEVLWHPRDLADAMAREHSGVVVFLKSDIDEMPVALPPDGELLGPFRMGSKTFVGVAFGCAPS